MKKTRTKLLLITAAILIAAVISIVMAGQRSDRLILTDADTGKVYARYPLAEGACFSVAFQHSVNKTPVEEIYENRGGRIVLTGCIYYSFGAGVAEELDPSWTLSYGENGEMILSDINLPMNDLTYVVGTVYDHMLTIGGEQVNLRALGGRNSRVHFEIS